MKEHSTALISSQLSPTAHDMHRRANELFGLHGRSADGPRMGESDVGYCRRLLQDAAVYSPEMRGWNFNNQPAEFLESAFKTVIDDAVREFKKPEGELRSQVIRDESGRTIRHWYGHPENTWGPFKGKAQKVAAWNPNRLGTGENAPGAIVAVGMQMSDGSVRAAR